MKGVAASPRQIRFLESKGFEHVVDWSFEDAKSMVERIAANGWRVPQGVNPKKYKPKETETSVQPGPGMNREDLLEYIIRMLNRADDKKLSNVYHFVLHLIG